MEFAWGISSERAVPEKRQNQKSLAKNHIDEYELELKHSEMQAAGSNTLGVYWILQ